MMEPCPCGPPLQTAYSDALPSLVVAWTRAQHAGSCTPEELHAMQVGAVRCALDLTEMELQVGVSMGTIFLLCS